MRNLFSFKYKGKEEALASFINKIKEWGPYEISGLRDLVARDITASEPNHCGGLPLENVQLY